MTLSIIGQACIDEIISTTGELRKRSLGGVLYSYAALERVARQASTPMTIRPIGFNSLPDQEILAPLLSQLQHFDLSTLTHTHALTNRVQLVYHTDSDRTEHCPTILPTITINDLRKEQFIGIDGLFVNMISGFDITIDAMETIAEWSDEFGFHIHLDIHALALGPLSQGEGDFGHGRKAQGLKNWQRWIRAAHTLQLNELEADHIGEPKFAGEAMLLEKITRMSANGELPRTEGLILTRAAQGATVFDLKSKKVESVKAPKVTVIDSTGSGDVFGAAFIFHLLAGKDLRSAAGLAVAMATWNTQLRSIEDILG